MSDDGGSARALQERVEEATRGTPYAVTPRDDGFDVGLDLADARWHTVLGEAALRRTFVHEVRFRDDGSYAITDVSRSVSWVAGAPGLSGSASVMKGRVIELGAQKAWGLDASGRPIKVADFRFGSEEGRQLVTLAGESLGLRQRRGTAELIGLGFAAFAIVGLVVGGLVTLVLWLLGVVP